MVEGGMRCVKYVLFLFNLIFFLAGLGLIICGAVVQTQLSTYFDFFGGSVSAAAILLICVGGIIFIIGFFGCCGAYKENYCMTMTFALLLCLIFILEIAAGIAAYVMKEKVQDVVTENMMTAMNNYGMGGFEGVTDSWDNVQQDFNCCGVNNYTDWEGTTSALSSTAVPDSCCMTQTAGCGSEGLIDQGPIYTQGCIDGFIAWVKNNIYIVGGVGIGLAFVQIFGIFLACCMARTIKKEYETV